MKTLQEAYDKMVGHLKQQGCKSYDGIEGCLYRMKLNNRKTLKCAVGALIDDEHYDVHLEGKTPKENINVRSALAGSGWPVHPTAISLYQQAQEIHDYKDMKDWEFEFKALASRFNLESE